MTETGYFGGSEFIGLDNFARLFVDPEVLGAFRNSVVYTLVVLAGVPISAVIASLMNNPSLRLRPFFRALFFLPVVTIPAAAGLAWGTLLNGNYGPLNHVLGLVGIDGPYWLQDPNYALLAVAVVGIWSTLGYNMILFMAGLKGIPREMYEAAELDGAGRLRQFFSVTIPLLSPTTFFVSVTSVITSMQMFDLMYIMIGADQGVGLRNPAIEDTQTVVYLFYTYAFKENDRGYASALAVVLLLAVLALTFIQFRFQRRWVHYG
jgi:multiple sugar transport system permease protein